MSGQILVSSTPSEDGDSLLEPNSDQQFNNSLPRNVVVYAHRERTPIALSTAYEYHSIDSNDRQTSILNHSLGIETDLDTSTDSYHINPMEDSSITSSHSPAAAKPSVILSSLSAHRTRYNNPVTRPPAITPRSRARQQVRHDSFIGDDADDDEDDIARYIDTTPAFNMPLTELGCSTQEESKPYSSPQQQAASDPLSQTESNSSENSLSEEYKLPPLNQMRPLLTPTPPLANSDGSHTQPSTEDQSSSPRDFVATQILSDNELEPTQILSSSPGLFQTQMLRENEPDATQIISSPSGFSPMPEKGNITTPIVSSPETQILSHDGEPHRTRTRGPDNSNTERRDDIPLPTKVLKMLAARSPATEPTSVFATNDAKGGQPVPPAAKYVPLPTNVPQMLAAKNPVPEPTPAFSASDANGGQPAPPAAKYLPLPNNVLQMLAAKNTAPEPTPALGANNSSEGQPKPTAGYLPLPSAMRQMLAARKSARGPKPANGARVKHAERSNFPARAKNNNLSQDISRCGENVAGPSKVLARHSSMLFDGSHFSKRDFQTEQTSTEGSGSESDNVFHSPGRDVSARQSTEQYDMDVSSEEEADRGLVGSISQLTVSSPSKEEVHHSVKRNGLKVKEESGRPKKRARTRSPSFSSDEDTDSCGTRVFALWSDGYYYSGAVMSVHNLQSGKYLVLFDDSTYLVVGIGDMRLCQLRIGDQVMPTSKDHKENGRIIKVSKVAGGLHASVQVDSFLLELNCKEMKIKRAWIDETWDDRTLLAEDISYPDEMTTTRRSPQKPTRASASAPPIPRNVRSSRKLAGTGFVISLLPTEKDFETRKEQLALSLMELGAVPLEDWTKLFIIDGRIVVKNHHWRGKFADVKYGGLDLDRVFLLADAETTKPRYLFALAFGIPCLRVTCVEDFKQHGLDNWSQYALPAGKSTRFNSLVSQRLLLNWAEKSKNMSSSLTDNLITDVFRGKSVLFIGKNFVPEQPTRSGTVDQTRAAFSYLPKLVLAMGASTVEAVSDKKYISESDVNWDYVFLPDGSVAQTHVDNLPSLTVAHLKEALISGMLFPRESEE